MISFSMRGSDRTASQINHRQVGELLGVVRFGIPPTRRIDAIGPSNLRLVKPICGR